VSRCLRVRRAAPSTQWGAARQFLITHHRSSRRLPSYSALSPGATPAISGTGEQRHEMYGYAAYRLLCRELAISGGGRRAFWAGVSSSRPASLAWRAHTVGAPADPCRRATVCAVLEGCVAAAVTQTGTLKEAREYRGRCVMVQRQVLAVPAQAPPQLLSSTVAASFVHRHHRAGIDLLAATRWPAERPQLYAAGDESRCRSLIAGTCDAPPGPLRPGDERPSVRTLWRRYVF